MVLLEAMQHKVIPMAFDSFASVRDIIIPRETGLLVTPFNLNEYANQFCILYLLLSFTLSVLSLLLF